MIDFNVAACQTKSSRKKFGLCDDPPPARIPAYIDENNGKKWIAVVVNEQLKEVTFTAIDNCIEIRKPDNTMHKRCDGFLTYDDNVIFVELKARGAMGNLWVKDGEAQLRTSIGHFMVTDDADNYTEKKAYIANSQRPKFKQTQAQRMNKFLKDTGYVLRIENRIIL
jgi:hypothetical protein